MGFLDRKKPSLQRLKERDWTNEEDRKEVFRELSQKTDLKLKEILWTLTSAEADTRQLGVLLLQRFSGPTLSSALVDELNGKTGPQQRLLIRHIARCDPNDVKQIATKLLMDPDKRKKSLGVELVNALPMEGARSLISELLKDPSAEVRLAGLTKLLEDTNALSDSGLKHLVFGLAADPDEHIRFAVLQAVVGTKMQDAELQQHIINGMKDESYNIQSLAAQTLGDRIRQGDAPLEEGLIELLSDGSTSVRSAVIKALLEAPDRPRVIRLYLAYARSLAGWVRDRALESLKAFSRDLVEPIIQLMYDDDEEIRLLALGVGGNFEDPRCVPPIINLLKTKDWWTRMTAAETLGRISDQRAVKPLIDALEDDDVRWTAIESLSQIKDPSAIGPISKYLSDPTSEIRLATLEALAVFGARPEILKALENSARSDDSRAIRDRAVELLRKIAPDEAARDLAAIEAAARQSRGQEGGNELERLLIDVRNRGGSDLHISVGLPPLIRMHGVLEKMEYETLDADHAKALVYSILTDRQRKMLEDDLQLDFCYSIPNIGRYRTNVFLQRLGFGGMFRVIPGIVPTLRDLGMPAHMSDLVNYHQGIIVVAGPSGSGKSTTLAALINLFNENKRAHILTIEDPVEFVHPMKNCLVNQREVGKHTQSFANALRGALREDPDVIVVGEMRDQETMKMALEAGETGHLVIATLNTTAAPKTVDRLIESFPPAEQGQVRSALSESLKAVICQNLMPRMDGTGRVALFEILVGTTTARTMIRDNKTFQLLSAMQIGKNQGMRTVDMSLMELVQQKLIAPEAAYLRSQDKSAFEPLVSPTFLREALGDLEAEGDKDKPKT